MTERKAQVEGARDGERRGFLELGAYVVKSAMLCKRKPNTHNSAPPT